MKVIDVLKSNRQVLACCTADEPILTIAERLSSLNIGAMPVCGANSTLIGVISERDLVRGFARNGAKLTERYVRDLMTREVVTCGPDDTMAGRRGPDEQAPHPPPAGGGGRQAHRHAVDQGRHRRGGWRSRATRSICFATW